MPRYYSRLKSVEERKRTRKAIMMMVVAVGVVVGAIFLGFKILSQLFLFISGLNLSNQPMIKEDMIPPSPPRIFIPYEATNSAQIKVWGSGEPGSTVYLTNNKRAVGNVVVDDSGSFIFADVQLDEGLNAFSGVAIDGAGNKSQVSTPETVFFTNKTPKLEVSYPKEGQQLAGEAKVEVKGETDTQARISINDRVVIVSGSGSFNYQIGLVSGENLIVVIARDRAGNETRQELKVTYLGK